MPGLSTLTPGQLEVCLDILRPQGLLPPNRAILAAIASTNPRLMRLLKTNHTRLSLAVREELMDSLGVFYCQMKWPHVRDGDRLIMEFVGEFRKNISRAGWKFA